MKGLNWTLTIVGSLTQDQKNQIENANIKYTSYRNLTEEEIVGLYKSHRVLSFCSLSEGFGLPILEALACGTPVITSDIEPMNTIARDHCILVNPFDEESMHAVFANLDYLLNNLKQKFADTPILLEQYEPRNIGLRYLDEYRGLYQQAGFSLSSIEKNPK